MASDQVVRVQRHISAPAEAVFAVVASPARHAELDGSGMVDGRPKGPDPLELGATFSMAMHQVRVPYRSVNVVTVFEPDRAIAWSSGGEIGPLTIGGQWWRYDLEPTDQGTLVTHSYDWGRASTPWALNLLRYPQRMRAAMTQTLERLERVLTG